MNETELKNALQAALKEWGRDPSDGGATGLNQRLIEQLRIMLQQLAGSWGVGDKTIKNQKNPTTQANKDNTKAVDDNTSATEENTDSTKDQTAATKQNATAVKTNNKNLEHQNVLNRARLKDVRREIDVLQSSIRWRGNATRAEVDRLNELRSEARELESAFNDLGVSVEGVAGRLRNEFTDGMKSFTRQMIGGSSMFAATMQTIRDVQGTMRSGLDFTFLENITKGLSTGEYTELRKQNLQLILAQGKFEDWSNTIDESIIRPVNKAGHSMILLTGGMESAARASASFFNIASAFGGGQTEETLITLQRSFADLQKKGVTPTWEQFEAIHESMMQDQDFRLELMKMSKSERLERVRSIGSIHEFAYSMGLTTEEALEFQKRISKIGQMDPRERIRQAARIQAVSGMVGMQGVGAEIAGLMQRPTSTLSPDEIKRLGLLRSQLAEAINQGMGDPAQEFQLAAALQKTNLDELKREDISYAKDRARNLEIEKTATEQFANAVEKFTFGLLKGEDIIKAGSMASAFFQTGLGQMAGAIGGSIASAISPITTVLGSILGYKVMGSVGRLLKAGGSGIATGAKIVGSKMVDGVKAGGTMLASGAKTGGSAIATRAGSFMKGPGGKLLGAGARFAGKRALMAPLALLGPVGLAAMAGLTAYDMYSTYKSLTDSPTPVKEDRNKTMQRVQEDPQIRQAVENSKIIQQLHQRSVNVNEQMLFELQTLNRYIEKQVKLLETNVGVGMDNINATQNVVNTLNRTTRGRRAFGAADSSN